MEITVRTLTPLWTGGVEPGKVDRIHETGIIGSLRWWMEALVRGMGGLACDPTTDGRCGFGAKKYEPSSLRDRRVRLREAGLCDVCQLFGATGWRQRFRLDIRDETKPDDEVEGRYQANRSYVGQRRPPTWYFPDKPRTGKLILGIQTLDPSFQPEVIAGLVQFIADWAAIGARTQMGLGVIEPENGRIATEALHHWLLAARGHEHDHKLPSLKNIFLARIQPKNSNSNFREETTFDLKYDLRRLFAEDKSLRHFIMGTVNGSRMAAKVKVSWPHSDNWMRVWGWLPEEAEEYKKLWNRIRILDAICQHLRTKYFLQVWREMSSPRDTEMPNTNEPNVFLHDLLKLGEASGDA